MVTGLSTCEMGLSQVIKTAQTLSGRWRLARGPALQAHRRQVFREMPKQTLRF